MSRLLPLVTLLRALAAAAFLAISNAAATLPFNTLPCPAHTDVPALQRVTRPAATLIPGFEARVRPFTELSNPEERSATPLLQPSPAARDAADRQTPTLSGTAISPAPATLTGSTVRATDRPLASCPKHNFQTPRATLSSFLLSIARAPLFNTRTPFDYSFANCRPAYKFSSSMIEALPSVPSSTLDSSRKHIFSFDNSRHHANRAGCTPNALFILDAYKPATARPTRTIFDNLTV